MIAVIMILFCEPAIALLVCQTLKVRYGLPGHQLIHRCFSIDGLLDSAIVLKINCSL